MLSSKCNSNIIDSYEMYAASALTSVTLVRYVTAGGMTVVGTPFYKNMGVPLDNDDTWSDQCSAGSCTVSVLYL